MLKSRIREVVRVLKPCGRYPKSWFSKNKPMLHDLVLTVYWGPTWLNTLLEWFLHGGWPHKSDIKKGKNEEDEEVSEQRFIRRYDEFSFDHRLQADMEQHWPEPKKKFWADEWEKHGRHSGMLAEEFFSTILDIYQELWNLV